MRKQAGHYVNSQAHFVNFGLLDKDGNEFFVNDAPRTGTIGIYGDFLYLLSGSASTGETELNLIDGGVFLRSYFPLMNRSLLRHFWS
jgi:hypothetical protein